MTQKDRLAKLLDPANTTLNGIDFVEIVFKDEKTLRVHFLNTVEVSATVTKIAITGGESIPTVEILPVQPADWSHDAQGRPLLTLHVAEPGDFSFYTLTMASSALDLFYDHARFSFKALCDSDFDCRVAPPPCPRLEGNPPPIDYTAKDFLSFRKALSDFSALRNPEWQERSEADFGVMFMESLSSLGDDLSYTQDRVAAEGSFDTATERRSLVRHARLVDYEPKPAVSSHVLLQFDVVTGPIPSGLVVSSAGADGSPIDFETGDGLIAPVTGGLSLKTYVVDPAWNRIDPYFWDDSQRCLSAGSTEMWVANHGLGLSAGRQLLIDTTAVTTADPPIRELVVLTKVEEQTDALYGVAVTHLVFRDKLKFDHDLTNQRTTLAGNLVPATQGRRYHAAFAIESSPVAQVPLAVVRTGPNATTDFNVPQYLYTLPNTPVVWLDQPGLDTEPLPEIVVSEQPELVTDPPVNWTWRRSLLNADEFESAFTLDLASYRQLGRDSEGVFTFDYDGVGDTIRFGDGVFGDLPEAGSTFQVVYRVGRGAAGNVARDSITLIDPAGQGIVSRATNPFAATGGADAETAQHIRKMAPEAFRKLQFRAVRASDYQAAAERRGWVQRAGTVFRWTGSWLTVFTSADPLNSEQITIDEHLELIDLLNRYRLAGYESYAPAPRYASLDITISVCARPDAFRGDVEASILSTLGTGVRPDGTLEFFHPDRFTFGTPLERSALEAAIQDAYGVAGVTSIVYRRRGVIPGDTDMPDTVAAAFNEILRVDNDPNRPERGSLKVLVGGGK